ANPDGADRIGERRQNGCKPCQPSACWGTSCFLKCSMRFLNFFLSVAFCFSVRAALPALSDGLVYAKDGSGVFGYKDTPKLPWCDYLVHDPDRPAPRKIDPGPSPAPAPTPADAIV